MKKKALKKIQENIINAKSPYFPEFGDIFMAEHPKVRGIVENPKTDNDVLFNLQYRFYEKFPEKDDEALCRMYYIIKKIALCDLKKEKKIKGFPLDENDLLEKAEQITIDFMERFTLFDYTVKKSFVACIHHKVLESLYHMTRNERFEKYVLKNNINIFGLSEEEKENVKKDFEKSICV